MMTKPQPWGLMIFENTISRLYQSFPDQILQTSPTIDLRRIA